MVLPVLTGVRAGIQTALLIAKQSAKGVLATNFTTADSTRVWSETPMVDFGRRKSRPGPWMTSTRSEATGGRYGLSKLQEGTITTKCTPKVLELFLRSNWGPYAAGVFALGTQIAEWYTLAWLEKAENDDHKLVRIRDVFFHRLTLLVRPLQAVLIRADYAGIEPVEADAPVAGVTLPAMLANNPTPADTNVFAAQDVQFRRDPAGANVSLVYHNLDVTLDQRVLAKYWMTSGPTVYKGGKTNVTVDYRSKAADETWPLLQNAMNGTKETFRMLATAPSPVKTLTIDMPELDFEFEPIGHNGVTYTELAGHGQSHESGAVFASISLV